MAVATLHSHPFPPGTLVAAYHRRTNSRGEGAPGGSPTETATVAADSSLTFTALEDPANGRWGGEWLSVLSPYMAYAFVNGEHRWVSFRGRRTLSF